MTHPRPAAAGEPPPGLRELAGAWSRFWFAASPGRAEALFRVGYAAVLLLELSGIAGKLDLLFSTAGMHPATPLDAAYTPVAVRAVHALWVVVAACLLVGLRVRVASLLNLGCVVYFFGLRGAVAPHAADWIAHSMAFYLVLMRSDTRLCVERTLGWRRDASPGPVWPKRLAQLNAALVYFTAGVSKLGDPRWMDGRAFGESLSHPLLTHFYPGWLVAHGGLLVFIDYAVIVWELTFPLLLVPRWLRPFALLSALAFQLTIDASLRVGWFTVFASANLLIFADDLPFWRPAAPGAAPRRSRLRPLVHAFLALHLALVGAAQVGYVLRGFGARAAAHAVLYWPPLRLYTRLLARTAYFDVWPSAFFLDPVRFLYYEASHPGGALAALPPFDARGRFDPPKRYWKETREGLLNMRLASAGATPAGWQAFVRHLVSRYREAHGRPCPEEIRVYRVVAPLEAFAGHPKDLDVPKRPVLTAEIHCTGGTLTSELHFHAPGRRGP